LEREQLSARHQSRNQHHDQHRHRHERHPLQDESAKYRRADGRQSGLLILYGCGDFITNYEGIAGYETFRSDLAVMYLPELATASGALVE
jgi:hypothetical protein